MRTIQAAWSQFWSSVNTCRGLYLTHKCAAPEGKGFALVSWPVRFVAVCVMGPLFGFEQAWLCYAWHERGLPQFPGVWAGRAHLALARWVERRAVWYRWVRPECPESGEVGYHWPIGTPLPYPRPQVFTTDDGVVTTHADGSITVTMRYDSNAVSWTTPDGSEWTFTTT